MAAASDTNVNELSFFLGAVEPDPFTVRLSIPLTEVEFREIVSAASASSTDTPFHVRQLERNYAQYIDLHRFVTIVLSIGREFAAPDRRRLVEPLMSAVVNWLASMSLFLDHEETDIKRRYGALSSQWDQFKTTRSAAYDTRVGYRFATKFRNYVLHCGLPLTRVEMARPPSDSRAKQNVRLMLGRQQLLSTFDWGATVRKDLSAMEEQFELQPLIADAMQGLREVWKFRAELNLDESFAAHSILQPAISRVRDAGIEGHPTVFQQVVSGHPSFGSIRSPSDYAPTMSLTGPDGASVEVTPVYLPVEFMSKISEVLAGDATRESLWSKPAEPFRPKFDPAAIKAQLHQHERGVQVISAWLDQEGHTPELHRIINAMIDEDDDVGPVLTGLIGISAVLAHVAAGALGTSAPALLSGLAGLYTSFDDPIPPERN